jgi:hypothetical protein
VLSELANVYARDTLKKWVPEVEVVEVRAARDNAVLRIRVRFSSKEGRRQTSNRTDEVALSLAL